MGIQWMRAAGVGGRPASPLSGGFAGFLIGVVGMGCLVWAGDPTRKGSKKPTSAIPQVAAIDKGIAEGWAAAGIKPARSATDEEFLRRAYLDLVGRIPTVQEARAFLGMREHDKRGKLVEYLLNHADFAKN